MLWLLAFDAQAHVERRISQQFHGMPVAVGRIGPVRRFREIIQRTIRFCDTLLKGRGWFEEHVREF